jgi:hypothetical protein
MIAAIPDLLVHLPIALVVMIASWLLGHRLGVANAPAIWMGWFAGAAVCIMREITQQEYRWIAAFGQGQRANMSMLEGLKFWDWNAHSLAETLGAVGLSALVALVMSRRN